MENDTVKSQLVEGSYNEEVLHELISVDVFSGTDKMLDCYKSLSKQGVFTPE
jgi:hypothetical protein